MSAEGRRLTLALLLSLLIHAQLLNLTFGGEGLGLPSFGLHWREQRIEAHVLHLVLVPAQLTAAKPAGASAQEPLQQVSIEQTVAGGPALSPSVSSSPPPGRTAKAVVPKAQAEPEPEPEPNVAVSAKAPLHTEGPGNAVPAQIPETAVIAMERADEDTFVVPAPLEAKTVIADVPGVSSPEAVMPAPPDVDKVAMTQAEPEVGEQAVEVARPDPSEREAQRQAAQQEAQRHEAMRQEAARIEAARLEAERQESAQQAAAQLEAQRHEAMRQEADRIEAARLEAERQEAARQAVAQQEAQRHEAMRQEAARVEAARLEAERREAARQAAAQLEAQRHEAMRQEAARIEAARLEAERQESARQAAARQEAQRHEAMRQEAARMEAARLEAERRESARQAAAQQEAAHLLAEQEAAARREARLRAIGRQLDEEAARREAASTATRSPSRLPLSLSTTRRVRLWGRTHPNAELVQYAEAWARKIQFNTAVDTIREVAKRPHTHPMVTVAIRSDGSVESVTFVLSSGVAEVDEAIRRIVEGQRPYTAFPTALAREYDVVEIRRTWHFDTTIQLY